MLLKPIRTPWNHIDLANILGIFAPNETAGRILHAKIVLETGRKDGLEGVYCWNHNAGNIRFFGGNYDHIELCDADEIVDGKRVIPAKNYFRAYNSLEKGVEDLIYVLSNQMNFRNAWDVLVNNPDPVKYVEAAKKGGYFTGDLTTYSKSVKSIFEEFSR